MNFPDLCLVNISASNLPDLFAYNYWGFYSLFAYGAFTNTFEVNSSNIANFIQVLLPETTLIESPFVNLDYLTGRSIPAFTDQYSQSSLLVSPFHRKSIKQTKRSQSYMPERRAQM